MHTSTQSITSHSFSESPLSYQEMFEQILSLQGATVEVGISTTGEHCKGRIINTMFDSFLLEVGGKNKVVRFSDLMYLNRAG